MMSKLWSGKGAALAVAGAAGAVLVAYVSLTLASPEQVSSAGLGPGWQCSRVAFVLTTCTRAGEGHVPAFLICRECDMLAELPAAPVRDALTELAAESGFQVERATIEALGLCPACADAARP